MKYIFWDIDGTLLKTGLAGVDALRDAIKCRFGIENFQFSHPLAGMTDSFIFRRTIKHVCSLVILGPVPLPNCVITGSRNTSTAVTAPAVS